MKYLATAIAIMVLAALMRLISLSDRPMHTDEAVHAFKLGRLLENGVYIYDKNEYHGPTLNYLSLIPAWIKSQKDLNSLDEKTLRTVPAVAGLSLVLLVFLLGKSLGWPLVLLTSALLAVSPAMTFFSRYYIHEMLLILFNAGALISLFRYSMSGKPAWIVTAGIFTGLMVSTKETWIIIGGIEVLALVAVHYYRLRSPSERKVLSGRLRYSHLALFFMAAALVAVVLFSSFFNNPPGIADSVKTYGAYFSRATDNGDHVYPWYYYIRLISLNSCNACWFRADVWLLLLGVSGMVLVFFQKPASSFARFLAFTFLFSGIVFSVIPYKTPWNILFFYAVGIFLNAWILYTLMNKLKSRWIKGSFLAISGLILLHLAWQSYADNFIFPGHPCNPYVYAHPGHDVLAILDEVEKVAKSAPEGNDLFIEVIVPHDGYWPLPWYLRHFPHAGWWPEVDLSSPAAPLIICAPECSEALTKKLFEIPEPGKRYLYIPLMDRDPSLRPGVRVKLYLRKDYWDRYKTALKS